jgi:hypothetical protein
MMTASLFTRAAGIALTSLLLAGCQDFPMAAPQPSLQSVQVIRTAEIQPLQVGDFALAPGKPASLDQPLGVRAVTLRSPYKDSFVLYLRESVITDLKAAGKYDPASKLVVKGWLTENRLDGSLSDPNSGALGARFLLMQDDRTLYDKEFKVDAQWPTTFLGAVAIPEAINQYTTLYRELLWRFFRDDEFRKAAAVPR